MNRDELDGKAKQVKGKIKQGVGDLTDDERLREEGLEDEAEGDVQETLGTVRRKVGQAVKDLGETIKRQFSLFLRGDLIPLPLFVIFARFWSALGHPI